MATSCCGMQVRVCHQVADKNHSADLTCLTPSEGQLQARKVLWPSWFCYVYFFIIQHKSLQWKAMLCEAVVRF